MSPSLQPVGVRNPLQLFGLYLAWAESALSASLFATQTVDHWSRYALMITMALGLAVYVAVSGYILVYLVRKNPAFLFNPSDFDKGVQHLLFNAPEVIVQASPPVGTQTVGDAPVLPVAAQGLPGTSDTQ